MRMQTVQLSSLSSHPLPAKFPSPSGASSVALRIPVPSRSGTVLCSWRRGPNPCHRCSPTKKSATPLVGGKHAVDSLHNTLTCPSKRSPLQHSHTIPTFGNPLPIDRLYSPDRSRVQFTETLWFLGTNKAPQGTQIRHVYRREAHCSRRRQC